MSISTELRRAPAKAAPDAVIVADWSAQARETLRHTFAAQGWAAFACGDGTSARALLGSHRVRLLVTELRLDDGPTLQLIEHARTVQPEMQIVVTTCHDSIATAIHCMRMGVSAYLLKPTDVNEIVRASLGQRPAQVDVPQEPMRLERAVWEYMHRVILAAGSITRASELLGVERRSLRRMVAKLAPP